MVTGTLANACPACKAEIGKRCRAKNGGETEAHKARRALPAPATAPKATHQPGQREATEDYKPAQIDELDDARALLRNATFGWSDPTLEPLEVIRAIVESTASYYTEEQWSERETEHTRELDGLREDLTKCEEERALRESQAEAAGGCVEQLEVDLAQAREINALMLADLTKARDRVLELERSAALGTLARVLELEARLAEIRKLTEET